MALALIRSIHVSIVRPQRPLPSLLPDEVGMVIADPHIVHDLPVAGIVDFLHRDPPILRVNLFARLQVAAGRPAFDTFEERVFQHRAEVLPTRVQTGDPGKSLEHFLDRIHLDGRCAIPFVACQDFIADLEIEIFLRISEKILMVFVNVVGPVQWKFVIPHVIFAFKYFNLFHEKRAINLWIMLWSIFSRDRC